MALIRKKELQQMKEADLKAKLTELKKELVKLNAKVAIGTIPESPGKIRLIKKTIARINTKLNEFRRTKAKI